MAMSETRRKALAYLRDGKVIVHSATQRDVQGPRRAGLVEADVIGQHSTYLVRLRPTVECIDGCWSCTCHNDDCAHIASVQLVTGHPSGAAR